MRFGGPNMAVHDWTRVEAGVFHHFHLSWIEAMARALNAGILPDDYYALGEQHAAGFEPDVLTLRAGRPSTGNGSAIESRHCSNAAHGTALLAPPPARIIAGADTEFYRRKQNTLTVRHVSGDRVVSVIEIVSPGNKSTRNAVEQFVKKAADLLDRGIHMLVVDLLPPGKNDPHGLHSAIWDYVAGQEYCPPPTERLTLAAYESDLTLRTYVEPVAVGRSLPGMPLFLEPGGCVHVPLEATYETAWSGVPRRWRDVLSSETA
jgi:hypothetical protein